MQLPIGAENRIQGVIDLIEMNALIWRDESLGAQWDVVEIPDDMKERPKNIAAPIETVVDIDEAATEALPRRQSCRTTSRSVRWFAAARST